MTASNINAYFIDLYEKTNKRVLAYIIAKCGDTEDISDIFQETYLEIVKIIRKHGNEYIKNPEAFVINVAQKIFYLFYYMDMPIKEVAEILSISESNVKNRIYRTLKEIRSAFIRSDGAV